jgi:hypothetical protein
MKFYVSAIRAMTGPTLALLDSIACAAPVTVQVSDTSGQSLADVAGYAEPILFDKPGTVVLGCNSHDHMVAYIQMVSMPYFAKTFATGKAKLEGLAPGKYNLKARHFNLPRGAPIPEQSITISSAETAAAFNLNIKAGAAAN